MELTGRKISSIMADRTPTKRYSLETSVCRNCNGNIVLKNHPLDLFGKQAAKEGILRDLEKFCGFKITFEDCFPARIYYTLIVWTCYGPLVICIGNRMNASAFRDLWARVMF